MTAPIWAASPPEVHSSLLSAGPGAGPLLASAAAWTSLAAEYTTIADELTGLLAAVQAGAWQGPSAEAFVAANAPYLVWLLRAGADATVSASAQQTAAAAYTGALAAMPTMAELAANHATHGVLVGTNFFGINTIPIALNEADYARMWLQAAAVMTAYHATATAAVASSPQPEPAPMVLKTPGSADATPPQPPQWFTDFAKWLESLVPHPPYPDSGQYPLYAELTEFFNKIGFTGLADPLAKFFAALQAGSPMLPPPGVPGSWLAWTGNPLSFFNPGNLAYIFSVPLDPGSYFAFTSIVIIDDLIAIMYTALFNPQGLALVVPLALVEIVTSTIGNTIQALNYLITQTVLIPALLPALAATGVLAPAGVLGGLGIGAVAHHFAAAVPPPPAPPPTPALAMAQPPASAPAPAPAPSPSPAPAPAPAAAAAPPPGAPPPTPAGPPTVTMPAYMYMVGGLDMGARRGSGTSTRKKAAPKPDSADAPADESAEQVAPQRRRRRSKATMLGRGHEYMDLDQELIPDLVTASDRGTGMHGFAGAARRVASVSPSGLTALADNGFGGGAVIPMMPTTWPAEEG